MAEPFTSLRAISADESLGIQGEAEWSRLRRQLELAEGFWLGFLFTPSGRSAEILRRRLERQLKAGVRSLETLRPRSPEELPNQLPRLLTDDSLQSSGCVWLEAVRSGDDWQQAWTRLMLRSNERRDQLRRRLQGGLILAAPLDFKPLFRDSAPDLWSIRNLVLEIPALRRRNIDHLSSLSGKGLPSKRGAKRSPSGREPSIPLEAGDVEKRRSEAARLLKRANSLLAQDQAAEAVVAAFSAVDLLSDNPPGNPTLAESLYWLARTEQANGDLGAAEEHIWQALRVQPKGTDRQRLDWLDLAAEASRAVGSFERSSMACQELVNLAQKRLDENTESPQALRDLSVSLNKLGDVQRDTGNVAAALNAFLQSLNIRQRLLEQFGESPQSLRDLSISLERLGDMQRAIGDFAAAQDAFRRSLQMSQRFIEQAGVSREAMRDLSVSINKLGELQRDAGNPAAALGTFRRALQINKRLLNQSGESPQALHDLAGSYFRLAQVSKDEGSLEDAADFANKCEEQAIRLIGRYGEMPERIRGLEGCQRLSAEILEQLGKEKEAAEKHQQADELRSRLATLQ